MDKPKFTPGPWHVNVWGTGRRTVEDGNGLVIAEVHRTHEADEIVGNSRIIAAAPEMHWAIKIMRQTLLDAGGDPMPSVDAIIAKAEGRNAK